VILTSPLESFTVGHTLVLSRGLIDVLPDEASLAMALSHELSHVLLGHRLIDTKFAFADRMMIGDAELLRTLAMPRDAKDETAADAKVVELLDHSPYKEKLASAGLFLRIVAERSKLLPELIQPHVGDHVTGKQSQSELINRSPELKPQDLSQVPALPIGARLVVDPWDGRLELLRSAAALPGSMREKTPLGITPLTPHLRYPGSTPPPLQTRGPETAPKPVAAAEVIAPTVPTLRELELSVPSTGVPQVPLLAPVPDLALPPNDPGVPSLAPVPSLEPLQGEPRSAPGVLAVPEVVPVVDRCAIEGTDAACSR
jgi:hypothetical protein